MTRALAAAGNWLRGDPAAERLVAPTAAAWLPAGFLAAALAFLAVLCLALALAAGRLAATWQATVAETATLQVIAPEDRIEAQARAALDVLRATPGVRSVRMVDVTEQAKLLEPWLGPDVPMDSLPLPLLIEVSTDRAQLDEPGLVTRLGTEAPGAVFDDHTAWRLPLVAAAGRLAWFALGLLALVAAALAAASGLAAQSAVAAAGPAIETLRLVGARDGFIARPIVRRLVRRAVVAAALGTVAGILLLALLPPAGEPGLFPAPLRLSGWQWGLPVVVPVAAGLLAWLVGRLVVARGIRRWS
ncbi:MAG: cell division protein FtsX [Amaricoccus sp.]